MNSFPAIFLTNLFSQYQFISSVRGIMPHEAPAFYEIFILQFLHYITFYEHPNSDLKKLKALWTK